MVTWKDMIDKEMQRNDDSWENLVQANISQNDCCCSDQEDYDELLVASFDRGFDSGFGTSEGDYFTVWTHDWVYFPVVYDGAEWASSVPRWPMEGYAKEHVGG